MKSIAIAAALFLALPVLADNTPPAAAASQPQGIVVSYADLQSLVDKLGEVPLKYAQPLMQELQRIASKSAVANQPPAAAEPKKR